MDTPHSVDLDGDMDMETDGEDQEDVEEQDEKEEEEVDEDEEEDEDEDEDDGKEPRTIGQGEMVNTSADDADTMVDNQPTVRPEHGQEMGEHTSRPQPPAPAPRPLTPEPPPPTTNSGDSYPQWAGVFGACETETTWPSGGNSSRS